MLLRNWEDLPDFMRVDEVRPYYEVLKHHKGSLILKRVFDLVAGSVLLIIFAVPMVVIAIEIKKDSPGPVFYRQERVTTYGKKFKIHKFRTMVDGADRKGSTVTVDHDSRITKVGAKLLDQILQHTYSLKNIELILIDSGSKDHTKELMKEFRNKHGSKFKNIKVLDNPKKIQAGGWNVVIENMSCDALIRLDAHAMIPRDFVEKNLACLNSGESVCGGPRTNVIDENTRWKKTLLTAEQSMFGSGIAPYRRSTQAKKYVNSVFHTCYRKEVIQRVGLFNEELLRTEDNEYHYRVRKAGYRICYDETIQSFYQTRNTLRGMIKQKYGNGFWIGKTVKVCPKCLSLYHLVPGAFVTLLVITGVIGTVGYPLWLELISSLYAVVSLVLSIACLIKDKGLITDLALIVIFPLLHISYGVGTVLGLI